MSPTVSVVIPAYNAERYVDAAVRSVLDQRLRDLEIIAVDDGSTDGTGEALDRLAAGDSRMRVIHQANSGPGSARNAAVPIASGEWLYFFDADDLLAPHALEVLVAAGRRADGDIVQFAGTAFSDEPELESHAAALTDYYRFSTSYPAVVPGAVRLQELVAGRDWRPSPCLQLVSRAWYEANGLRFPEGMIHEDNLFSVGAMLRARRVVTLEDALFLRRTRSGSITTAPKTAAHVTGLLDCVIGYVQFDTDGLVDGDTQPTLTVLIREAGRQARRVRDALTPAELAVLSETMTPTQRLALRLIDQGATEAAAARKRAQRAERHWAELRGSRAYRFYSRLRRLGRRAT